MGISASLQDIYKMTVALALDKRIPRIIYKSTLKLASKESSKHLNWFPKIQFHIENKVLFFNENLTKICLLQFCFLNVKS